MATGLIKKEDYNLPLFSMNGGTTGSFTVGANTTGDRSYTLSCPQNYTCVGISGYYMSQNVGICQMGTTTFRIKNFTSSSLNVNYTIRGLYVRNY